jgi:hypothetical protein
MAMLAQEQLVERLSQDKPLARLAGLISIAANPQRPPDWRALLLERDPLVCFELPDKSIRAAGPWFMLGCPERLKPHLGIGYRIARAPELRDLRAELESLVLCRQKTPMIARRLDLPVAAVQSYCRLWFDVRSRLKDRDFVHTVVLETGRLAEGRTLPAGWLWKVAAYLDGLDRLEPLLAVFRLLSPTHRQAGIAGYLADEAPTDRELRSWIERLVPDRRLSAVAP